MGGKFLLQTVAIVVAALAFTGTAAALLPEGFATTGQAHADWYWVSGRSHARWEFLSLPVGIDPYLAVETFLCVPVTAGTAPLEIRARLAVAGSAGGPPQVWLARLQRIQVGGGYALYFGQLFIPRRTVGSRLVVSLDGRELGFPVGVHPHSVRVAVGPSASAGTAVSPPKVPTRESGEVAGGAGGLLGGGPASPLLRLLPPCESPEGAPFLAPGTYQGSLGWVGPGTAPIGKGVYKVNLRAGQIVSIRVETEGPCRLLLLDPGGRPVGEIEGSSWLGLEYRAGLAGAWQIQVLCLNGVPKFDYRLTLDIR